MPRSNYVMIGKKSRSIVKPKEQIEELPNLTWFYEKIQEANTRYSAAFPTSELFFDYFEMIINTTGAPADRFLGEIIDEIRDYANLNEEEDTMLAEFPVELYLAAMSKNFNEFVS